LFIKLYTFASSSKNGTKDELETRKGLETGHEKGADDKVDILQ
jgi:hypothetical protein